MSELESKSVPVEELVDGAEVEQQEQEQGQSSELVVIILSTLIAAGEESSRGADGERSYRVVIVYSLTMCERGAWIKLGFDG